MYKSITQSPNVLHWRRAHIAKLVATCMSDQAQLPVKHTFHKLLKNSEFSWFSILSDPTMADHDDDAAPLIMSPPSPFIQMSEVDLEAGPSEQIQCRICLETDGFFSLYNSLLFSSYARVLFFIFNYISELLTMVCFQHLRILRSLIWNLILFSVCLFDWLFVLSHWCYNAFEFLSVVDLWLHLASNLIEIESN